MVKKTSKKRTTAQRIASARNNSKLVPSLRKYRRRKTLKPQEKSAITRAEKKIKRAGTGSTLLPITSKQARQLKDKSAIVGDGIRAIRQRAAQGAKVRVVDGELVVKIRSREWHFEDFLPFQLLEMMARIDILFDLAEDLEKELFITVWTASGRLPQTFPERIEAQREIETFVEKYRALDPDFDDWFLGLAWFMP